VADRTPEEISVLAAAPARQLAAFINAARELGLPVVVNAGNGRRSKAQARANLAAGRSWTKNSLHVTGRAVDIDLYGFAPDDVPIEYWQYLGELGERFGLRWGGRWRVRDWRHFEY
jgi:hypothetical protein